MIIQAFDSHDPKTGELLQRSADDSSLSLAELVRQERFSGGSADQKNMDYEMANRIATDGKFINSLDYVDENAESLARKKMKSEVLKKAFAVQGALRFRLESSQSLIPLLDTNYRLRANKEGTGFVSWLSTFR